jgi:hypothetical protein
MYYNIKAKMKSGFTILLSIHPLPSLLLLWLFSSEQRPNCGLFTSKYCQECSLVRFPVFKTANIGSAIYQIYDP